MQRQCSDAVDSMALQLESQLQLLGEPAMDLEGATLVEQALLLGEHWSTMLCISLANTKTVLHQSCKQQDCKTASR